METWKPIWDFKGAYLISNYGRVKSMPRKNRLTEKILTPLLNRKGGYLFVRLSSRNLIETFLISRLVADHFVDNPLNLPEVNHKDRVKTNNHAWNLEWVTKKQNMEHAFKH